MSRKNEIRNRIDSLRQELEKLEAVPDGDQMLNGTVLAIVISYSGGRLFHYVGLKIANQWNFSGRGAPNEASWDNVVAWLTHGSRRVVAIAELAKLNIDAGAPSAAPSLLVQTDAKPDHDVMADQALIYSIHEYPLDQGLVRDQYEEATWD